MSRSTDLLRLAAEALDDGRDPFTEGFLVEHAVTLDEVYALSEMMAEAARVYLALRQHPDWLMVLTVEVNLGPEAARTAEASLSMPRTARRIRDA